MNGSFLYVDFDPNYTLYLKESFQMKNKDCNTIFVCSSHASNENSGQTMMQYYFLHFLKTVQKTIKNFCYPNKVGYHTRVTNLIKYGNITCTVKHGLLQFTAKIVKL